LIQKNFENFCRGHFLIFFPFLFYF